MSRMVVERLIDGEMALIEVEAAPSTAAEQRVVESRVQLLPFVRVQREKLMPLAEQIALKAARNQKYGQRLPSGVQLMQAIIDHVGAVAAGKAVERVETKVVSVKKLNEKKRTAKLRAGWSGRPFVAPTAERTIIEYSPLDPQELLLFFEEESEAMLSLMKYC